MANEAQVDYAQEHKFTRSEYAKRLRAKVILAGLRADLEKSVALVLEAARDLPEQTVELVTVNNLLMMAENKLRSIVQTAPDMNPPT